MKYHMITFATEDYLLDAKDLCKSALNKGGFDTVKIYGLEDIDSVFKIKNNNILSQSRGSGFWIWKPYIIQKHLLEIEEGDILCYCDSSYLFLDNIRTTSDNWLSSKNISASNRKPNSVSWYEKQFIKFDTLVLMNVPRVLHETYRNSYQVWGGFFLTRRCFNSIRFVGEWLTYAQDYRIITDIKSTFGPEHPEFKDHRHDQSILSILFKKWGIHMDEINNYFLYNKRMPL